jgi:hypothetical protein
VVDPFVFVISTPVQATWGEPGSSVMSEDFVRRKKSAAGSAEDRVATDRELVPLYSSEGPP